MKREEAEKGKENLEELQVAAEARPPEVCHHTKQY
jgi:hypothetical protein